MTVYAGRRPLFGQDSIEKPTNGIPDPDPRRAGLTIRHRPDSLIRPAHRDADTGAAHHSDVVQAITDRRDLVRPDAVGGCDPLEHGPLVDPGIERFQQMDRTTRNDRVTRHHRGPGLKNHSVSEIPSQFFRNLAQVISIGGRSHPDGVLKI